MALYRCIATRDRQRGQLRKSSPADDAVYTAGDPQKQTEPLQRRERKMCAKRRTGVCETAASEVPETRNRVWTHSNGSACPRTSHEFLILALCLLQPKVHIHLAVHRGGLCQVLLRLLPLA